MHVDPFQQATDTESVDLHKVIRKALVLALGFTLLLMAATDTFSHSIPNEHFFTVGLLTIVSVRSMVLFLLRYFRGRGW